MAEVSLEVGKQYRVRSWESLQEEYGDPSTQPDDLAIPFGFCDDMASYCGTLVTISQIYYRSYHDVEAYDIDEDSGYTWGVHMFDIPPQIHLKDIYG